MPDRSSALVTVLFTDLVNSTKLLARTGDVDAQRIFRAHHRLLAATAARHGGQEVKWLGDGLMAAFSSAVDALRCAAAMQEASRRPVEGQRLSIRIGINAGETLRDASDYFGTPVVVARRLCDRAEGGQILCAAVVAALLEGRSEFSFSSLGDLELKGLPRPVPTVAVRYEPAAAAGEPGTPVAAVSDEPAEWPARRPAPPGPPLVGRQAEVSFLQAVIDEAITGRGGVVLLVGEAGVGKTTLVREIATRAGGLGTAVWWGACWAGDGAPAYWPWSQVLRNLADGVDDETLRSWAGGCAGDVVRLVPELASRLAARPPAPDDVDPEGARFRLFDALASLLEQAGRHQAALIVLDDLHWADESSLLLLAFVADRLRTMPIAVIGCYRDTDIGPGHPLSSVGRHSIRQANRLALPGLGPDEVRQVMAGAAGSEPNADLAAHVHRRTAGNPLFVTEITRLMAAHGALGRSDVSVGVPRGVGEVIERRLARLPERCVALLRVAAVVGESFGLEVVARAVGAGLADILAELEPALTTGVVSGDPVGQFRFAHGLFREVLYEGLDPSSRSQLHRRVAEGLEERHLQGGEVSPAELAHHFGHAALAGDAAKAVRYTVLAAREAAGALAYSEAVVHLERALRYLDLAEAGVERDRPDLLLELSGARWRAGDRPGAREAVDRAIALARRTGRGDVLARAALGLQQLGGTSGSAGNERIALLEAANAALADDDSALRARVLARLAQERYHSWSPVNAGTLVAMAEQAVGIARRVGDAGALVAALAAQHDTVWRPDRQAARLRVAVELEAAARAAGDADQAVEALLLQSVALLEVGDPEGIRRLERFVAEAEERPHPRLRYLAATRRATLALVRGDPVEAELHMARAAEVAAAYGEPDHRNVSVTQRFAVSLLREQSSETVEEFREVYAANWTYAASVAAHEALAYLEAGEEDRASAAIRRIETEGLWERIAAVYDPDTVSNSKSVLSETVVIGQAAAAVGAHRLTERIVAVVEPYADRCVTVGGAVSFLGAVAHYLGLMTLALGRNDEAQGYFHAALAVYRRLGASGWARLTQRIMAGVSGDDRHNTLRPDGGEWVFSYLGLPARVRDAKGVRDLAVLLSRPGQEVAAVVLMAQGEVAAFGADEVLDAPARAAFRRRLDELDTELADAEANHDLGRSSSVRAEREALAHELASALGLGGRPRGLGDPAERARKAVAARLKDSIERIAAVHPELGRHLRDAVRTGTFCCYSPATPTAWHVTGRRLR